MRFFRELRTEFPIQFSSDPNLEPNRLELIQRGLGRFRHSRTRSNLPIMMTKYSSVQLSSELDAELLTFDPIRFDSRFKEVQNRTLGTPTSSC